MTKIDKASGLPKLPEGQWWEVVECEDGDKYGNYPYYGIRHSKSYFAVVIYKEIEIPASVKTERGRWPWSSDIEHITPASTGKCSMGRRAIYDYDLAAPKEPELTVNRDPSVFYHPSYAKKITPEAIQRAAEALLKSIEDDRAHKAKLAAEKALTASLLGAYPPKSLNFEGTQAA